MSDEDLEMLFMKIDANNSGGVDWDEFTGFLLQARPPVSKYSKKRLFDEAHSIVYFLPLPIVSRTMTSHTLLSRWANAQDCLRAAPEVADQFGAMIYLSKMNRKRCYL